MHYFMYYIYVQNNKRTASLTILFKINPPVIDPVLQDDWGDQKDNELIQQAIIKVNETGLTQIVTYTNWELFLKNN